MKAFDDFKLKRLFDRYPQRVHHLYMVMQFKFNTYVHGQMISTSFQRMRTMVRPLP